VIQPSTSPSAAPEPPSGQRKLTRPQAAALAAWEALNERQQTWLRVIYGADQDEEEWQKGAFARGEEWVPAEVWRWQEYEPTRKRRKGQTAKRGLLQARLDELEVRDPGAGSTIKVLTERRLIEVRYEDDDPSKNRMAIKMTTHGRATARAGGVDDTRPARTGTTVNGHDFRRPVAFAHGRRRGAYLPDHLNGRHGSGPRTADQPLRSTVVIYRRTRLLGSCVVIALLSAGCASTTSGDPAPAPPPTSTVSPRSTSVPPPGGAPSAATSTPVSSWLPTGVRDRPDSAVAGTLLSLDPCSLLGSATVRSLHLQVGDGTAPITAFRISPHACGWSADRILFDTVFVTVGSAPYPILHPHPTPVAGKLAYTMPPDQDIPDQCTIWLPVNGHLVMTVAAQRGDHSTSDVCAQARTAAATVATMLDYPLPAQHPGPAQGWDACVVLADVLGSTAHGYAIHTLAPPTLSAFDLCTAIPASEEKQPPTSAGGYADQHTVEIKYDYDPTWKTAAPIVRIQGHPGAVTTVSGACAIDWIYRPDPSGLTDGNANLTVENTADTCEQARADVVATVRVLNRPAPEGARTRQVLYPAG
jgi:hypothetical protein